MCKVYTGYHGASEIEYGLCASLKLGDYLSVQAHKPCSISHLDNEQRRTDSPKLYYSKKGLNLYALSAKLNEIFFCFCFFFCLALQSFHLHWKK